MSEQQKAPPAWKKALRPARLQIRPERLRVRVQPSCNIILYELS